MERFGFVLRMAAFAVVGDRLKANGQKLEYVKSGGWSTGYGVEEVHSGQHEWRIKLNKIQSDVVIGISSDTNHSNSKFTAKRNTYSYAYYSSNGNKWNNTSNYDQRYGQTYTAGDIIGIHLDLDNATISFSIFVMHS